MTPRIITATLLSLVAAALALHAAPAHAADGLAECRTIDDPARRLACYDALAGRAAAPVPSAGAPDARAAAPAPPAADAPTARETPQPGKARAAQADAAAPAPPAGPATDVSPTTDVSPAPVASAAAGASPSPDPGPAIDPAPTPDASPAPDESRFGMEQVERNADGPDELVSRIVGDYDGWFGDTRFELENGQVWQQVGRGKSRYRGPPNPRVWVRRRAFGSYRLQVEGSNRTVRVERVR